MVDLDNFDIEFPCPKCSFYNKIKYKQARLRDVIICRGCKINIILDDHMNECRKARVSVKRAIKRFQEQLRDIKIEIKI
jgi:hypothetical protein